jgi:hypothetical protein
MARSKNPAKEARITKIEFRAEIPEGSDHRIVFLILRIAVMAGAAAFVWREIVGYFTSR